MGGASQGGGLQYAVRVKGNSGFLFGINYCRNNARPVQKGVRFQVKLKDGVLVFPSTPVDVPDSSLFIWPMNLDMGGVRLNYATAQPLFHSGDGASWVFVQDADLLPELSLAGDGVDKVELPAGRGEVTRAGGAYILSRLHPGSGCVITITRKGGVQQKIVVLSREEARRAWILPDSAGKEHFYLSRAVLYTKGNQLFMTDTLPFIEVKELEPGGVRREGAAGTSEGGLWNTIRQRLPEKKPVCSLRPKGALQDAQWLVTSVGSIDASTLLYHREFQKEFSAGDPATIKSAKLVLAAESECRVRINDKWVDQPIGTGSLTVLDVTGYVQKGDNVLLMDFPYETGGKAGGGPADKAFAGRVLVEYFNADRLDFSTDTSWLATDLYYFPPTYGSKPVYPLGFAAPKVVAGPGRRALVLGIYGKC